MATLLATANKQAALALAKKKYGKNCFCEINAKAISQEKRAELLEASKVRQARRAEIEALIEKTPSEVKHGTELFVVAEFVADVNGNDPSIPQLRAALERRRAYLNLQTEKAELREQAQWDNGLMRSRRYEILQYRNEHGFPHNLQLASGDTWAEVMEKLEPNQREQEPETDAGITDGSNTAGSMGAGTGGNLNHDTAGAVNPR